MRQLTSVDTQFLALENYCGHLDFGIVADREQMRDVWCLMEWLRDELEELEPPTP
jgi:uncharacterized protein DUF1298